MEVTIRHTPNCPNLAKAEERVREALAEAAAQPARIRLELVATPEEAERLGFVGSPTILVDGTDPFAVPGASAAFACRIYETPDGPDGVPSVGQLRATLLAS